jgi:putative lipase involved disintegration of autophagic bodies
MAVGADQVELRVRHVFRHPDTAPNVQLLRRTDVPLLQHLSQMLPTFAVKRKQEAGVVRTATNPQTRRVATYSHGTALVPDMKDKATVVSLAYMAANAYLDPTNPTWHPFERYHLDRAFGWEGDGLRGYVWGDDANSTFVVSLKGTSAKFLWSDGGPTAANDRLHDNLLFSCCCARVDYSWTPVCGCFQSGNLCGQTCVEQSVSLNTTYYDVAAARLP